MVDIGEAGALLQSTVLVIAKDRFISTLLAGLIELSGRRVAIRTDDEGSSSAVQRSHPALVMFDCALGITACSEIAAIARLEGLRMLMFSASHTDREARDIARLYGAPCFVLPIGPREFMASLDSALEVVIQS